jgi:hypothetical protein
MPGIAMGQRGDRQHGRCGSCGKLEKHRLIS